VLIYIMVARIKATMCILKTLLRRYKPQQIVPKKQTVDPAAAKNDSLVDSAVTFHAIHVHYEEEWWQHTPLESTTNCERL